VSARLEGPRLARLVQSHVQDLQASGLTNDTIMDAGIYSASGREVEALLGYGAGPGMVIPYDRASATGTPTYARVKLDHAGADGKRYRSPKGRGNHLYIPFAIDRHALCDVRRELVITEGEKKTLAAIQAGLVCVGLSGVWSWRHRLVKDGPSVPIDDLHVLPWAQRHVVIVFDSDAATNEDVRAAERALAVELTRRGARVTIKRLPERR
jgi:putative DNA primase/helicase